MEHLNKTYSLHVEFDNIKQWDMKIEFPTLNENQLWEPLMDEDFWRSLTPIKEANTYISKLQKDNNEVYLITATHHANFKVKVEWIQIFFPMIEIKNIIVAHNKKIVGVDVLIDDYEVNLIGGNYHKILLDYPWNRNIDDIKEGVLRVNNWSEIYKAIANIQSDIWCENIK